MLVIKTSSGTEIRIPVSEIVSVEEIEPSSGKEREVPPHAYLHREGVNKCAACWRPRAHPSHVEHAVRG